MCSQCGMPQPPSGPLRTSDGTPISASTYLALAALAGDALVCTACLSSEGGESGEAAADASRR